MTQNVISFLGVSVLIGIAWLISEHRKRCIFYDPLSTIGRVR